MSENMEPMVRDIAPVETPVQRPEAQFGFGLELVEVDNLVRASEARRAFSVDGTGLTVAVLDTGLRKSHVDFDGRVRDERNYTADNGGDEFDASDGDGHGTNVTGIIAAGRVHVGIAPGAGIVPLKVLPNSGGGSFFAVNRALEWVRDNHDAHGISAVCMSLSDGANYANDEVFLGDVIERRFQELRALRIPVVVAAGNDYFTHDSEQGMAYPSILRGCLSVGAVYDAQEGAFSYGSGARANSTAPDRLTPFSQRLHKSVNPVTYTRVFAPGAPVTSSGIHGDEGESVQQGTSQATPVTVGAILLMQELYARTMGERPEVDDLLGWLEVSGVSIHDGDDEDDNVEHTRLDFRRLDVFAALGAIRRRLEVEILDSGA